MAKFSITLGAANVPKDILCPRHRILNCLQVLAEEVAHPTPQLVLLGLSCQWAQPMVMVVAAADGASVLICARDGDRSRLGPRSLGPATRFVVDHVPCPVLLVWPGEAPGVDSIPPPPPPGAEPPPPPHERR